MVEINNGAATGPCGQELPRWLGANAKSKA
jgi:hypothetical protein